MDQLRESSLLFSLNSLLETERERVEREAREAQRRRDEELQRVAELAARKRLADQQHREAQERRARLEREREQLEQERIAALKRATVERARIEAEGQLRLIEVEQARQHDLQLAQIRASERTARYRLLSRLSSGALVLVVAGVAAGYFGLLQPALARQEQHLRGLARASERHATTLKHELEQERARNLSLLAQVREVEQRRAAPQPPTPTGSSTGPVPTTAPGGDAKLSPHGSRKPGRVSPPPPPRKLCPDDGDPLRPCLR